MTQQFASDNNAGLCPAALEAFLRANSEGHTVGYGGDAWTERVRDRVRALFEADAEVFLVFGGTAANALALGHMCRSYHAVLAHVESHVATDEAGAAGFFSGGAAMLTADTPAAKLTPEAVARLVATGKGVHSVKPRALSLTQATELGTVYSAAELVALTQAARRHGLKVHMDGARFANAVAHLGCTPADISWRAGVDVLCFGGVKNGLAAGEVILFFDRALADEFEWRVKQAGQLNSKMRFVSAPWVALLENDVWLENARHANAMARRLADGITRLRIALMVPVESNGVFAEMSPELQERMRQKGWRFYPWNTGCRLMCAWDTEPETVDRFLADLIEAS
jgi:threonine aldolase